MVIPDAVIRLIVSLDRIVFTCTPAMEGVLKYSHSKKIFIAAAVEIFLKSTANAQPSAAVISISEKIMMLKKMVIYTKRR